MPSVAWTLLVRVVKAWMSPVALNALMRRPMAALDGGFFFYLMAVRERAPPLKALDRRGVAKGRLKPTHNLLLLALALIFMLQLFFWCSWDDSKARSDRVAFLGKSRRVVKARTLVVHTCHGMSNRLRALASAMAVANATGRQLHVIWAVDEHMEAKFHDLFENQKEFVIWDRAESITGQEAFQSLFDRYNYMDTEEGAEKYKYINDSSPNHIYVKTAYLLNSTYSTKATLSREFNKLMPNKEVRQHFEKFRSPVCRGWAPCTTYIGVHVRNANPHTELRGGDHLSIYTAEAWKTTEAWRNMSSPVHFVSELKHILKDQQLFHIFVSADSAQSLAPFVRAFGDRVLFLDKRGCFDRSAKCQRLALADLFLLAHSSQEFILGSYWSSFTEVATYAKRLKVRYAGVDFMSPGRHAVKCGATSFHGGRGILDGLAIVAAAQGRHEVLLRSLKSWLREDVLEVILVDWSSDPPLRESLSTINDSRLRIIEVQGESSWVLTRAFNVGFRHSSASRILKMDADTELLPGAVSAHPLERGLFYAGNWKEAKSENERHMNGIFYARRDDLEWINGFDERIETYGWDDEDIYARFGQNGVRRTDLDLRYFFHVAHNDSSRMSNSNRVSRFTDVEMLRNKYMIARLPPWGKTSSSLLLACHSEGGYTCQCKATSTPLGLIDSLPQEEAMEATLMAYREVVGYTGGFSQADLQQVILFDWFEGFLRRHFHNQRQWLVVMPRGTLAERVVGIQIAVDLAQAWNRSLQIVWKEEGDCSYSFDELFSTQSLDIIPDFHGFERDQRGCIAFRMDRGTDWLSASSPNPKGKQVVFLATRGFFRGFPKSVAPDIWIGLDPTDLGKYLDPTRRSPPSPPDSSLSVPGPPFPFRPILIVSLEGTLVQRLLALASAYQLGAISDRHVALVWNATGVGGVRLGDLFSDERHVYESLEECLGDRLEEWGGGEEGEGAYDYREERSLKGVDWEEVGDVMVRASGRIDGDGSEDAFNRRIHHLVPSQGLLDVMYGLQVGKNFHGLIVGENWEGWGKATAYAVLQGAYREQQLEDTAFLFLLAEAKEMCEEAGEGIICVHMCGQGDGKDCHMRHVAAMFVMSSLPRFFFLDWKHREVEFILRRKGTRGKKVDFAHTTLATNLSLAETMSALVMSPKVERSPDSCAGVWHLLLQFPFLPDVDAAHAERNREYWETLRHNLEHAEVNKIHLFTEKASDRDEILKRVADSDRCEKLVFVDLGRRLHYNDTFDYANRKLKGELCAVLNADVYLGEGFGRMNPERHLPENRVLALSRHEKVEGPRCGYGICHRYKHAPDGFLSHDSFLFLPPLPSSLVKRTGFFQQIGSENVLIHIMKEQGLEVRNPCRTMKTYHNHCTGIRPWQANDTNHSWESLEMSQRLDVEMCGEMHCGDGWVEEGPEVVEDLEE